MSKTLIRYLLLPTIGVGILFALLLYWNNTTTLTVQMYSSDKHPLHPQLYYAKEHQPYSEQHSLKPVSVKNNRYTFVLPDSQYLAHLRFDPAMRKTDIHITRIELVQHKWFHTFYSTVPLTALSPGAQIVQFKHSNKEVSFQSTGKDPNLALLLHTQLTASTVSSHITLFVAALILYLLLAFGIHLYLRYRHEPVPTAKLILYALFLALTLFKTVYYKDHIRFSYPPDELAHLSYIVSVHEHHHFIPDYEHMVMLNNKHRGNYLSHPPLYYELMNLTYDEHLSPRENVDNFRTLSIMLFLLALMLILAIGFHANLSVLGDFVFLSLLSSVPMFAYIGASISNDTLAILGASLFAFGFVRLLEKQYTTATYLLLAIGILIAYFSKLTDAILIFFALLFYLVYLLATRQKPIFNRWHIMLFALVLIPVVYYQLAITLHYHALVPTFNVTHPTQYLDSPFFVPEQYRQHLSPLQWGERMLHYIQGGWFGIHSHHSFTKESWVGYSGLLILHLFAFAALFMPCTKTETQHSYCLLGKIILLSLFAVLVIQYLFSYKAHLHSGYLGGLQPRYLLPFMFGFAIMSSIFAERFQKSFLFTGAVILICIQAIYSDFFYFLQYYR